MALNFILIMIKKAMMVRQRKERKRLISSGK